METDRRKVVVIALVAVLVVATAAVVLVGGIGKSGAFSASVTDASGQNVTMSKAPERIVSGAPDITEMVCALGLTDKLVAVTDYDDYPAQVKEMVNESKTIGGFYTPSFEKVVSFAPDLVLLEDGVQAQQEMAKQLRDAGYKVVLIYAATSVDTIYKNIDLVGRITGQLSAANQLVSEMQAKLSIIDTKVSADSTSPRVMYVTYAESGFTNVWPAGSGTAIDQIISMAGGQNAFSDIAGFGSAAVSQEELTSKAGSVDYIVMSIMYSGETPENMTAWFKADPIWKDSPAVKSNNIYYLTGQGENIFNRQSVRMVDAVQLMAEILHPDAFGSKVPHESNAPNVIGDEYQTYLTSGTASQTPSVTMVGTTSRA